MGSSKPLMTVIIPTLNEQENIEKTILSVKSQNSGLRKEILVCDGGSTDKTVEIAKKHAKVLISPKKGKVAQMNYAAMNASGDILIFLDADTIISRNYLENVYRNFVSDKKLVACSVPHTYKSRYIISAGTLFFSLILFLISPLVWALMTIIELLFYLLIKDREFFPITKYQPLSHLLFLYYVARSFFNFVEFSGSNICVRRDIFKKVGGFKPVPDSNGIDSVFSSALRKYCRYNNGRIRMLYNLVAMTDPRFINRKRIMKRIKQHKKIAKYYQKLNGTKKD